MISLINNIVSEDKLEILEKFGNSSSTEVNASEIERFIDEKFGETITANTEKKSHRYREYDKGCHANVDEMNIKTCYRSGYQALQNKKWSRKLNF